MDQQNSEAALMSNLAIKQPRPQRIIMLIASSTDENLREPHCPECHH